MLDFGNAGLLVVLIAAGFVLVSCSIRLFSGLMCLWLVDATRPKDVPPEKDVIGAGRVAIAMLVPTFLVMAGSYFLLTSF